MNHDWHVIDNVMNHDWHVIDDIVNYRYRCARCEHVYNGKYAPRNDLPISVDDERNPDGSLLLRNCDEMIVLKVQES